MIRSDYHILNNNARVVVTANLQRHLKKSGSSTNVEERVLINQALDSNIASMILIGDKTRDCANKGILPSEAIAVLSAQILSNISHFYESGIANGQSTEFFQRYFNKSVHHRNPYLQHVVKHTGIDMRGDKMIDATRTRLKSYGYNVHISKGDGFVYFDRALN